MLRAFTAPSQTLRAQKARGISEASNIAFALGFAAANYISQLPVLYKYFIETQNIAIASGGQVSPVSFADLAGWGLVWSIFGVVLIMYILAGVVYWIAKRRGSQISAVQARRAMFWAAFMCLPLCVVTGITMVFDQSNISAILGVVTLIYFLWYWSRGMNALGYDHV